MRLSPHLIRSLIPRLFLAYLFHRRGIRLRGIPLTKGPTADRASEAKLKIDQHRPDALAAFELPCAAKPPAPHRVVSDLFLDIPTYLAAEGERARVSQG